MINNPFHATALNTEIKMILLPLIKHKLHSPVFLSIPLFLASDFIMIDFFALLHTYKQI